MSDSVCAHPPCTCTVSDGGIEDDSGRRYCADGCKRGEGCVHPSCGCSMDSVDNTGSEVPKL